MPKKFLLDTNVLVRSPKSIYVFEDNDVLICNTTLEELDNLKTKPGETGFNAREAIRELDRIRKASGGLRQGIRLPGGGTLRIVQDCIKDDVVEGETSIPIEWPLDKPDNRIIDTAMKNSATLVTNDISMLLKAESANVPTESFRNEQVSDDSLKYTGRHICFADKKYIDDLYTNKLADNSILEEINNCRFEVNEFITIIDSENSSHTALAIFDGVDIKLLPKLPTNFDIKPRNVGQTFALAALLAPADKIPLVILKGPAGTAKTFLSLAAGIEQTINTKTYNKTLILRPNIKFDEDIGYLKGTEMDKILPLIRPCIDNLEQIVAPRGECHEMVQDRVTELFERGYVVAEALAYLRGRSIADSFILIDEAQNTTPNQMLGIITRAGIGSKIVIVGDPDQIDNPKIDKKNNGLVFAAEKMKGNKLCVQLTFENEECVRSELALAASQLLL